MIFFRLWSNLVKMKKIFFLEIAKPILFAYEIKKKTNLLKGLPREKLEVNPFHVLEAQNQL